tara:strand:- start:181 stop:618 length:438 start_codon:yes stop_codon:yes gene_type:complete
MPSVIDAYHIAMGELGQQEIKGEVHNPRIIEYHKMTTLAAKNDETNWCSAFVCWCLEQAGIRSTRMANARSYLNWGNEVATPYEGCIVVLKRGKEPWQGHVGFFISIVDDEVLVLGGNQGDRVSVHSFHKSRILAFRETGLPKAA